MTNVDLDSAHIISWLLDGDPVIRWQTMRDLTCSDPAVYSVERARIAQEGWGQSLLELQDPEGTWASSLYSRKWISTTYTMLLLARMELDSTHPRAQRACQVLLDRGFDSRDGGINFWQKKHTPSETCVTGMVLFILCSFDQTDDRLSRIARHLLQQQMPDGGWNCQSYRGATHSSMHTTVNVLEGLMEFERRNDLLKRDIRQARLRAHEFLFLHRLFRSHRTEKVIDSRMTRLSFPPRWHYDILRILDYFQNCRAEYDPRMAEALQILLKKRNLNGSWPLQNRHPGKTFFEMESVGQPSRWNTLRALRVLKWCKKSFNLSPTQLIN